MIKVTIRRAADGSIRAVEVKGHAGYADPGKDIVCAGVSAVTVGTVNAVEALAGVVLPHEARDGFLAVNVPDIKDDRRAEQIRLLLESMRVMLQTIEQSYGEFVAIVEKNE